MVIYGINPVVEALRAGVALSQLKVVKGKDNPGLQRVLALAAKRDIAVERPADIRAAAGNPGHQGVCANCPDALAQKLTPATLSGDRWVMLDGLQDPQNFGAALRVCECLGFNKIIFHKGNSCGITPTAIKASAGAIFHLSLYMSNLNRACKLLQDEGIAICVMDGRGTEDLYEMKLPERYCMVVGSEGDGVRFIIRRQADRTVQIPLRGQLNSLNVSCALTVALSECQRRDR